MNKGQGKNKGAGENSEEEQSESVNKFDLEELDSIYMDLYNRTMNPVLSVDELDNRLLISFPKFIPSRQIFKVHGLRQVKVTYYLLQEKESFCPSLKNSCIDKFSHSAFLQGGKFNTTDFYADEDLFYNTMSH